MPQIIVNNFDGSNVFNVRENTNFLDWCIGNFPPCFDYDNKRTSIKINDSLFSVDEVSESELIELIDFDIDSELIEITQHPRGGVVDSALDVVTSPFSLAFGAVSGLGKELLGALIPTPEIPNLQGEFKQSPNSNLKAAVNSFRNGQAISDKSGETYAVPDFIQPTISQYINNRLVLDELFCVGVGRYDKQHILDTVSDGSSLIDNLTSSTAEVYDLIDGDTVPAELQKTIIPSNNVDGQTLEPSDSPLFIQTIDNVEFYAADGLRFVNTETIVDDFNLVPGSQFTIDGTNAGLYEVDTITDTGGNIEIVVVSASFSLVTENVTFIKEPPAGETFRNWTDWFDLEGTDLDDIWVYIQMPDGCQKADSSRLDMEIRVQIDDNLGIGPFKSFTATISEVTKAAQFRTFKASDEGVTLSANPVRIRARRITSQADAGGEEARDKVVFEEAASVKNQSANAYGDVTLLYVRRKATQFAIGGRSNKINCIARRLLQTFNTGTGLPNVAYTFTRQAADYIFYLLYDLGGYPLSAIDTDSLFDIRDNLPSAELGYFDYALDDADISLEDRLKTAANAMRATAFKIAGVWTFTRNESTQLRSALINGRIMRGDAKQNWSFARAGDFDSVRLRYVDPTDNERAFIERRINTGTGLIENGIGSRPRVIDFDYCRDSNQAANRADFEIRKIAYINRSVEVSVYKDSLYLVKGMKVGFADPIDNEYFSGEILAENSGVFDTSERFIAQPATTYYCYFTDDQGLPTTSPFIVTERSDTQFGFETAASPAFYLSSGLQQLSSRYIIATLDNLNATDFIVDSVQTGNANYATVKLIEYNENLYEAD